MYKVVANIGSCHCFEEGDTVKVVELNYRNKGWTLCERVSDGELQVLIALELEEIV